MLYLDMLETPVLRCFSLMHSVHLSQLQYMYEVLKKVSRAHNTNTTFFCDP